MYLISIYFDEKTNKKIQHFINKVAERTGNLFMIDGKVPPHITISAFDTLNEREAIQAVEKVVSKLKQGTLSWVSVGQFFPYVIYLAPLLNQYLHELSVIVYDELTQIHDIRVDSHYQPLHWLPHSTIGKKLSKEEMRIAFETMQESFGVFEGTVVRIGLAKPNPHRDIVSFELKKGI